jgi:signal peptidase I
MDGDRILVNKLIYRFSEPQRGDVIAFKMDDIYTELVAKFRFNEYEREQLKDKVWNRLYIKRVVGLPGDIISIKPPHVIVNGRILDDRNCFRRISSCKDGYTGYVTPGPLPPPCYLGTPADEYRVPESHYFVLGDNSRSSFDGRFWGSLKRSTIVGKAFYIYAPADRKRIIE